MCGVRAGAGAGAHEAGLGAPERLDARDLLEVRALAVAHAHLEARQVLLRTRTEQQMNFDCVCQRRRRCTSSRGNLMR